MRVWDDDIGEDGVDFGGGEGGFAVTLSIGDGARELKGCSACRSLMAASYQPF